jgi:hypothetical protein
MGKWVSFAAASVVLMTAGCAARQQQQPQTVTPTERPNLLSRELLGVEKTTLAHALSRSMKDPDSAKFGWGPVKYAANSTSTEYCGIVNGKNSYGGYTGYQLFRATLNADSKGQYTTGTINAIMYDNPSGDDLVRNVHYEELCIQAGYGDVSLVPR